MALTSFDAGIMVKSLLHYMLYTKTILSFQSNPKHKEFIEKARTLEHIGCFGLTEFHHGSFTQGMATVAHYDPVRKEFLLNSDG